MTSTSAKTLLANTFMLTALSLGVKNACALDIQIANMGMRGDFNAEGNINFDGGTGSFRSLDPFFF